jgi:hypothetical protein
MDGPTGRTHQTQKPRRAIANAMRWIVRHLALADRLSLVFTFRVRASTTSTPGPHTMKLLLRRSERPSSVLGKPIYILEARAEFSPDELERIRKFKFGKISLYNRKGPVDFDGLPQGALGVGMAVFHHATNTTVSVNDLISGKRIESKHVTEIMTIEREIKEAAVTFGATLRAASGYGGEDVINL